MRHGESVGRQDGKVFDYRSFLDSDIDIALKGLEGGLSEKTVAKVLQIYGSSQCEDTKYVKALMKSD